MDAADKKIIYAILWEEEDKAKYDRESTCYICTESFITMVEGAVMESHKGVKMRDHCYYTGKYRGAAHSGIVDVTSSI